jgi:hypothetical protein
MPSVATSLLGESGCLDPFVDDRKARGVTVMAQPEGRLPSGHKLAADDSDGAVGGLKAAGYVASEKVVALFNSSGKNLDRRVTERCSDPVHEPFKIIPSNFPVDPLDDVSERPDVQATEGCAQLP